MIARSLTAAGADVSVLGSRALRPADYRHQLLARMPNLRFGSEQPRGLGLYAHRAHVWLGGARAVLRTARELRPDVVHFQHAINRRFDHLLLRRLASSSTLVWTAHDVLPHERSARDEQRFARIYRCLDAIIVHSEPAAAELRTLCGVEATVVEHPVDESVAHLERATARAALGLPTAERILGAFGFIRPYKGYELLADVWESLADRAPVLLLMGELHGEESRRVAERLSACARVDTRLGFATEQDLHHAIAACDAVLLPYSAGSDSGVLHLARALGTPVIASDAPQLAASVTQTSSGAVVARELAAWSEAVLGELPAAPPAPPSAAETGARHLEVYRRARERARARGGQPAAAQLT